MMNILLNIFKCDKPLNILVLGFYNRSNLGDELYKKTIPLVFNKKHNYSFQCTDDINVISPMFDIIICGGGDIINSYFMEKVKLLIKNIHKPIYALSVGVQEKQYLHIFDHVFVRSSNDYKIACMEVGTANVTLIPDCVFLLPHINVKKHKNITNIGISIANPVIRKQPELIETIIYICNQLLTINKVFITFFAFNTFTDNRNECDLNVIHSIINKCDSPHRTTIVTGYNVINSISKMNLNICMRYHSCVLSILNKIPFISLSNEPKVLNLLQDYQYGLYTTNSNEVLQIIERLLAIKIKIKVPIINKDFINHIINTTKYRRIKVTKGFASFDKNLSNLIQVLEISNEQLYKKGPFILPDIDNSTLARIITYYICGNMESECLWGLTQNMNKENFVLFDALNYVYKYSKPEFFIYYPPLTVKRRCAIDIEPYLSKNHRAGWKYVVDNLMNFYKDDADLFVDSYVDRTFHWGYDVNRIDNKIPYVKPWIGFIHHTFAEVNDYNIKTLLQKELFIESLKNCKGIIVLSSYLAHQLIKQINVPVFTLTHPTLFVEKQYMFKYSKFVENENRKIIQIGAWMRNPVSIYKLSVHSTHKLKIKKAILQGNNMNVTFSLDNFSIEDIDNIGNLEHSVEIINTLTNTNYDILLSENIVFLDLIDCSAVNTVIECVVRNTPLIVNRHHALEEVLGKEYPGFYNTLEQAGLLISYPDQIKHIYKYLKMMDKTHLKIETFMNEFQDIICSI